MANLTLAGNIESFNSTAFRAAFASQFPGVAPGDITLDVTPASVVVVVRVVMASLSTAEAAANTLTNAGVAALSTRLGVTVEIITTIAVAMQHFQAPSPQPPPPPSPYLPEPSPPPPSPLPPPSSPPVSAIPQADGAAVGVILGLTGVIIFIPALFVTAKLSRLCRRRQSPDRRPPQGLKGGQRQSGSHRPEHQEKDSETAVSTSVSYRGPTATTRASVRTQASGNARRSQTPKQQEIHSKAAARTRNAPIPRLGLRALVDHDKSIALAVTPSPPQPPGRRSDLEIWPPGRRSDLEIWLKGPEETLAVLSPAARSMLKQRQARTSPHERRSRTDSPYELRRDETAGAVLGAASELRRDETTGAVLGAASELRRDETAGAVLGAASELRRDETAGAVLGAASELRRDETAGAVLGAVSPYAATATDFPPAWVASSPGGPAGLIVIASAPGHPPGHVAQLNAQLVGSISPRMPWFLPVQSPLPREAEADLTTPKPRRPAPAETVAFTASAPALTRASTPAALARARASTPASAMTPSRSRGETTVYYL
jgi:hypothetical protein